MKEVLSIKTFIFGNFIESAPSFSRILAAVFTFYVESTTCEELFDKKRLFSKIDRQFASSEKIKGIVSPIQWLYEQKAKDAW